MKRKGPGPKGSAVKRRLRSKKKKKRTAPALDSRSEVGTVRRFGQLFAASAAPSAGDDVDATDPEVSKIVAELERDLSPEEFELLLGETQRMRDSLPTLAAPGIRAPEENPVLEAAIRYAIASAKDGDELHARNIRWAWEGIKIFLARRERIQRALLERRPVVDSVKVASSIFRLAIFGDGGYRGRAQEKVFSMIEARHKDRAFHGLLHLGDTYFGGSGDEMLKHLVAPMVSLQKRLQIDNAWSLCGNHDIYESAEGYCGVLDVLAQPGRYFSLETGGALLVFLDSALFAERLMHDGALDPEQLDWLRRLGQKNLPTIAFSHHPPISSWGSASKALRAQVEQSVPLLRSWCWGHEHLCAFYKQTKARSWLGVLAGHGVFLEPRRAPHLAEEVSWYPPISTCHCYDSSARKDWPHGFLELEIGGGKLTQTLHVEGGELRTTSMAL